MNVNELYFLTIWVEENISDAGLPNLYSSFHGLVHQNTQPNQQNVPFEDEKNQLFDALRAVPLNQLTDAQRQTLDAIGILRNVGVEGVQNIEETLVGHAADIATAEQKIKTSMSGIQSGIKWAQQTKAQLVQIVEAELEPATEPDEILIRVRFAEAAAITNMEELRQWSKIWWEIVRGVTMLHGEPPEAIKIVGASKGSILFDLIGYAAFARVLLSVLTKSLEATERFQNLRLTQQQIRQFQFKNAEAERAFSQAVEQERQDKIDAITQGVLANIEEHSSIDGEVGNALQKSIEQLIDFLEKGGHVDFVMPQPVEEDEEADIPAEPKEITELRTMTERVRHLEQQIKLLENRSDE